MRWNTSCCVVVLVALAGLGCDQQSWQQQPASQPRARRARVARSVHEACDLTVEDGQRFAIELIGAADAADAGAIDALIDLDGIIDDGLRGREIAPVERRKLIQEYRAYIEQNGGIGAAIVGELRKGGSYCVVRVHADPDSVGVWCRLTDVNGGLVYHDYRLGRRSDGRVQAKDVTNATLGQSCREMFQPILDGVAVHKSRGIVDRLTKDPPPHFKYASVFEQIQSLRQQGDHAGIVQLYRQLPEDARGIKLMAIFYVQSASQLSPEEYCRALEETHTLDEDGTMDGLLWPYYLSCGQPDKALECLDRFNRLIGGDIVLTSHKAAVLLSAGRVDESRRIAYDVILWEPNLVEGYCVALEGALAAKDFGDVVNLLEILKARGFGLPAVNSLPVYAEFIKSPDYQDWLLEQGLAQRPEPEAEAQDAEFQLLPEQSPWPRQTF